MEQIVDDVASTVMATVNDAEMVADGVYVEPLMTALLGAVLVTVIDSDPLPTVNVCV